MHLSCALSDAGVCERGASRNHRTSERRTNRVETTRARVLRYGAPKPTVLPSSEALSRCMRGSLPLQTAVATLFALPLPCWAIMDTRSRVKCDVYRTGLTCHGLSAQASAATTETDI